MCSAKSVVLLSLAEPSDAADMVAYCNKIGGESDNLTFGENEFHYNEQEEAKFIADLVEKKNGLILMARCAETGEILGVGSSVTQGRRLKHVFQLGVSVRKAFWRQGIGEKIMRRLMEESKLLGAEKMSLGVYSTNAAAVRMYEKMGFEIEGLKRREVKIYGEYRDMIIMGLFL